MRESLTISCLLVIASRGTAMLRVVHAREAFQYRERRLTETEEIEKSRETKVSRGCERVANPRANVRARERTGFSLVAPSVHGTRARARARALATRNRRTRSSSRFLPFRTYSVRLLSTYCPLFPRGPSTTSPRRPPLHVSLSCSLCAK